MQIRRTDRETSIDSGFHLSVDTAMESFTRGQMAPALKVTLLSKAVCWLVAKAMQLLFSLSPGIAYRFSVSNLLYRSIAFIQVQRR